jgi:ubiquinol-cytochrome c reductase cytochrome b subunit
MPGDRVGWKKYLHPFLYKELPAGTGWYATLGTLCALLFGVMAVSGLFLAMYYNPSPDKAYVSIDYIIHSVPMGSVLRGIHHWGASAMIIAVLLHLLTNLFSGTYRAPREGTWIAGVCLLLITLGLGFTGYLLPWDLKSYWATVVGSNIPDSVPFVGGILTRLIRGGDTVSGLTLTRFYAMHVLLLPAILTGLTVVHLYLVRVHNLTECGLQPGPESKPYRFFPEHLFRSAIVFVSVFIAILLFAIFVEPPRESVAGTLAPSYLPRPEWYYMWLFQLLTLFSGPWESLASIAIPAAVIAALFALPFLSTGRQRPLVMAATVSCLVGFAYLTLMGFEGARPYGQVIPIPGRSLTASESRGLYLYAIQQCAYCHQIRGKGGHRTGPDLSNVRAKHRTLAYLAAYIRDARRISPHSIMPKYDLQAQDLQALADFVLALDFSRYPEKFLKREEVLKQ